MSTIHSFKSPCNGVTAMTFMLLILAFAVSATITLVTLESDSVVPHTQAGVAPEVTYVGVPNTPSWSDQWYDVEKSIPIEPEHDMPTF